MAKRRLRILFVDDDSVLLKEFPPDLEGTLQEIGIEAEVVAEASVDSALKSLREQGYHLIIVDLRFPEGPTGNDVLREILDRHVMPIIVYSGFQQDLDPRFQEHSFISIAPSKKIDHVITKVKEWNERRVFDFFSEEGLLASSLQKTLTLTMWEHVSRYWEHLPTDDQRTLAAIAGRIASTLIYDILAFGGGDEDEIPVHHGEIYIFSTPRSHLSVGDLLHIGDRTYAVLTPACDLISRGERGAKAKVVLLTECQDLIQFAGQEPQLMAQLKKLRSASAAQRQGAAEKIERMMRQAWLNEEGKHFFLPPFGDLPGYALDFLRISTEPYDTPEQRERLLGARIASLNREIAGELATRYSRFMLRLGQPAFQPEPLAEAMKNLDIEE